MIQSYKREKFLEFAKTLKDNGYEVYTREKANYGYFVRDNRIGYLEYGDYGYRFSTVHKPSSKNGTGYCYGKDIHNPTIKMVEDTLFFNPNWTNEIPIKYKDWNEFQKNNNWMPYKQLQINNLH